MGRPNGKAIHSATKRRVARGSEKRLERRLTCAFQMPLTKQDLVKKQRQKNPKDDGKKPPPE